VTIWSIWAALLLALAVYVIIAHAVNDRLSTDAGTGTLLGTLRIVFYCLAAAQMLLSYYLRRRSPAAAPGRSQAIPFLGTLERTNPALGNPAISAYMSRVVISLALSESMGVYGFVLFLLGGGFGTLYIFVALAALGMLYHRPRLDELVRLAAALGDSPH
jgi:hypothetical protein